MGDGDHRHHACCVFEQRSLPFSLKCISFVVKQQGIWTFSVKRDIPFVHEMRVCASEENISEIEWNTKKKNWEKKRKEKREKKNKKSLTSLSVLSGGGVSRNLFRHTENAFLSVVAKGEEEDVKGYTKTRCKLSRKRTQCANIVICRLRIW